MLRIAVVAEGQGDCDAVVDLLAKAANYKQITNLIFDKRVIRGGGVNRILKDVERLSLLASIRDEPADFFIIVADCEDACPVEMARSIADQWRATMKTRPEIVGGAIALLVREYEMIFLADLNGLKQKMGNEIGKFDPAIPNKCEGYRDAKGKMAEICKSGYKPTRDQRNFTKQIECSEVQRRSRSFTHLMTALEWLSAQNPGSKAVYP